MIVRILADNQYRLDDEHMGEVARLDNELLAAMDAQDEAGFASILTRLVEFVQQNGTPLAVEELVPSDVIVPAQDMTLAEAREVISKSEVQHAD